MAKQTDVRDSTTRPHLYVIAHLRFHIVNKEHMYISLYSFLLRFLQNCFINVIISCY